MNATATAPKRARKPRKVGEVAQERVDSLPEEGQSGKRTAKRSTKRSTKKKAAKAKAASNGKKRFRCEFLGVSVGDGTARIGIKIPKDAIDVQTAESMFCGRRVNCQIVSRPVSDDPDQANLPGVDPDDYADTVDGVCDVKRFSVSPKSYGLGLTFAIPEITVETLATFAKKSGYLNVNDVLSLDEIDPEED